MNDDDLARRFARLRPADLPDDLLRQLHAAEPSLRPSPTHSWLRGFLLGEVRPWPLAYAGLGAAWVLILTLHLFTPSPPSPAQMSDAPVPQFSGRLPDSTRILAGGFAVDRAFLLTRNNPDSPLP